MGLSSKQVSNRGLDWNQTLLQAQDLELPKPTLMRKQQQQQTQQQSEPLKCPRCDSTNTKFCYYNNYNKSQPRHFCRACKRHWTKGGTLRNVPVGGGRKNKRVIKKSSNSSTTTTSNGNINMDVSELGAHMTIQTPHQRSQNLSAVGDQKNTPLPSSLYQSLIHHPPPLVPQQNLMSNKESSEEGKEEFGIGNGIFLSSAVPFPQQNQTPLFPFSTSLRSSNVYNYGEEEINKIVEEPTINNNIMPSSTSGTITQPWEIPATTTSTTAMLGTSNYWSWEDIDSLVSTDLNVPWDDSDIKP